MVWKLSRLWGIGLSGQAIGTQRITGSLGAVHLPCLPRPAGRGRPSRLDGVAIESPDRMTRWRCSRCGNLTRFDVLRSRRAKEYWHFDLGGEVSVEDQEVLHDDIEEVRCRWCGATDTVEIVPRAGDAE